MSCLKPKRIRNPKYRGWETSTLNEYSFRVFGVPRPPNYFIQIPCNNCINCLKRKFRDYRIRLLQELQICPKSIFVTLTFDNPSLSRFKDNPNKALILFLDRIRKDYGKQVRHWFVAEYGKKKGRLHYHGILFNCEFSNEELFRYWKYGNTFVGYANEITAKYIVKYLTKDDTKGHRVPPRIISSKGIGLNWLDTSDCRIAKASLSNCIEINGYPTPIPRYYIDKMYTEREKEIMTYYLYMESDWNIQYVAGRKYTNFKLAEQERERLYKQYKSLGLVYDENYWEKRPRGLSADTRFRVYLDEFFRLTYKEFFNYGEYNYPDEI